MDIFEIFLAIICPFFIFYKSKASGQDVFVPMTIVQNRLLKGFLYYPASSLSACAARCLSEDEQRIKTGNAVTCNGYRYHYMPWIGNECSLYMYGKESITTYDKSLGSGWTIYTNTKYFKSFYNYRLVAIGGLDNNYIGAYGPKSGFLFQPWIGPYQTSTFPVPAPKNISNEGFTYNFLKQSFLFCGGQHVAGGTLLENKCYQLSKSSVIGGPNYTGPYFMSQGRDSPMVVSLKEMSYVFGGQVPGVQSGNQVEAFNHTTYQLGGVPLPINFTIEEFTSVTGACVISNEEQNWFVVTGGKINTTGTPAYLNKVLFVDMNLKTKTLLPPLSTSRSNHGCSILYVNSEIRFVVFGGGNGTALASVEFYKFTFKGPSWTYGNDLPKPADMIAGSIVMKLNSQSCNLIFISLSLRQVIQCDGNLIWNIYNHNAIPTGVKQMARVEGFLFNNYNLHF